jgi:hypothetical protein
MSLQDKASIVWPLGAQTKAGNLAAWNPQDGTDVEFDVVRATTKWRINESSAWEEVAANVLARDFTNGGCGDFTIEPARKFLFLNSTTGVTQNITVVSGVDYAVSFSGTGSITFSVGATGTLNGSGATALDRVSSIITTTGTSVTCTIAGTVEYVNFEINTNDSSVTYSTSWMKTLGSIVTRNADNPSLTGASALLNSTGGGMFLDLSFFGSSRISLSSGSPTDRVLLIIANSLIFEVKVGNVVQSSINSGGGAITNGTFYKIGLRYSENSFALYLDGVQLGENLSGNTFGVGVLNSVFLADGNGTSTPFYGRIRQIVVFNDVPTNTQLDEVTT